MNLKQCTFFLLGMHLIISTALCLPDKTPEKEASTALSLFRSDKQELQFHGIDGQEIKLRVKTKEWKRRAEPITEFWLTVWSTYEGKTVKEKLHRFMAEANKYNETITFRHFDKVNGLREINLRLQIELKVTPADENN